MSVPKSKRGESEVEFLQVARKLWIFSVRKCTSFPKRYTFYVSQPIANCATRIMEHTKRANSIYPTNGHEVQLKRDEFLLANAELYNLIGLIEVAREMFGIGDDAMKAWMKLIEEETRLLKGVMKKDKERYKGLTSAEDG